MNKEKKSNKRKRNKKQENHMKMKITPYVIHEHTSSIDMKKENIKRFES